MSKKHPPIAWSQRKNTVNLNIGVQDATDVKIEMESCEPNTSLLKISLKSTLPQNEGIDFNCEVKLFAAIEPALSSQEVKPRGVTLKLSKKNYESENWFWSRLTFEKNKNANIIIDWSQWRDEDELEVVDGSGGGNDNDDKNNALTNALASLSSQTGGGNDNDELLLDGDEIQKTLQALRHEQIAMKQEQLQESSNNKSSNKNNSLEVEDKIQQERRRRISQNISEMQNEEKLFDSAPKFGFAKDLKIVQQDDETELTEHDKEMLEAAKAAASSNNKKSNEEEDDDDELPPLV